MKFSCSVFYKIISVLLVVFYSYSCKKDIPNLPIASYEFSFVNECQLPAEIKFQNLSKEATIFRWDFGDGTNVLYEKNPSHIYVSEGDFTVKMTAYGEGGMETIEKTIHVSRVPQISINTIDTVVFVNQPVRLFGLNSSVSNPNSWNWEFGDSTSSNIQNPIHQYSLPGLYSVKLTATNSCGSSSVVKQSYIRVLPATKLPLIKKVTIIGMMFPPIQPPTVNIFFNLINLSNGSNLYNGMGAILQNQSQANIPISWTTNILIPSINNNYELKLFDRKMMPTVFDINFSNVQFNFSATANYPSSITISDGYNTHIVLDLIWQ